MTDIQGMRAQMRDSRGSAPRISSVSSGGGGVPFWIVAVVAGAVGFAIVLFAPRYFTAQRTAALPAFQDPAHRASPAESGQAPVPAPEQSAAMQPAATQPVQPAAQDAPAPVSRYAGKTLEEIVRTSDAVCEHRSQVVRNGGPPQRSAGKPVAEERASAHKVTAADEKLFCLLTEAPSRFCAPNQKRKATADIINYFKGIEYTNAAVQMAAKVQANAAGLSKATIDPQVVDAIEALLRAGYLTKEYREDIAANVPREIKDRFARVVGSMPNCPKPPWWSSFL
jgi:hypothetical protein